MPRAPVTPPTREVHFEPTAPVTRTRPGRGNPHADCLTRLQQALALPWACLRALFRALGCLSTPRTRLYPPASRAPAEGMLSPTPPRPRSSIPPSSPPIAPTPAPAALPPRMDLPPSAASAPRREAGGRSLAEEFATPAPAPLPNIPRPGVIVPPSAVAPPQPARFSRFDTPAPRDTASVAPAVTDRLLAEFAPMRPPYPQPTARPQRTPAERTPADRADRFITDLSPIAVSGRPHSEPTAPPEHSRPYPPPQPPVSSRGAAPVGEGFAGRGRRETRPLTPQERICSALASMNTDNGGFIAFFNASDPITGCFSNYYPCPVILTHQGQPLHFLSSEAAFQACKFANDIELMRSFQSLTPPAAARRASDCLASYSPSQYAIWQADWRSRNVEVMTTVLRAKFSQNQDLLARLLATNNAFLTEHRDDNSDTFWSDGGDGTGSNALGRLLMVIRGEFRGPAEQVRPQAYNNWLRSRAR